MHPELLSSLATEHRRDLSAGLTPALVTADVDGPARRHRAARYLLPRLRVSWTRTTLAATAGRRRGRSWIIVISATRTF